MDEKFTDCPRLNSGAVRGPSQIPCIYLSLKRWFFFIFFSFIATFFVTERSRHCCLVLPSAGCQVSCLNNVFCFFPWVWVRIIETWGEPRARAAVTWHVSGRVTRDRDAVTLRNMADKAIQGKQFKQSFKFWFSFYLCWILGETAEKIRCNPDKDRYVRLS